MFALTPYGGQSEDEESPEGWPQVPSSFWYRRHDEFNALMAAGLVDCMQVHSSRSSAVRPAEPIFGGAADFDLDLIDSRALDGRIQDSSTDRASSERDCEHDRRQLRGFSVQDGGDASARQGLR